MAVLFFIPSPTAAQLRFDPRLQWRSFETPHCVIHYLRGEDSLAQAVAQKAEWYRGRLVEIFRAAPKGKIQVVLDSSSDIIFGAATPFPNNAVFLNPTPLAFQLGHYDDWLALLVAHEFTHVVDIDKAGGLPALLRALIGRLYFPNAFGPQWLAEGIATYYETQLTGGGRSRDPYHDMILRMAFLENRVNAPDQNNVFLARWPGGNSSYVYGQSFYNYLAKRYGRETVVYFRDHYAGNLIPFRISAAMTSATSQSLQEVYKGWKQDLQQRYQAQAEAIRALGVTVSRPLTQSGYHHWSPAWSADGKTIYFVAGDPDRHPEIRAVEVAPQAQRQITATNFFETQMAYAANQSRENLFISQIEIDYSSSLQHDLWRLDLHSGKRERLTRGQRARHPAAHPSAEKIVYVTSRSGETDLWLLDLRTRQTQRLLRGGPGQAFFNPAWSPDGTRLALTVWQKGGYQDIWIFALGENRARPLLQDKAWDLTPCWSRDGRYVIFSSDRTGVFNLFAYDLETHRLLQLTNVLGGAFDPEVAPDDGQIAFVNYSSRGFDIHVMDWQKEQALRAYKVVLGEEVSRSPLFDYGYVDSLTAAAPAPPTENIAAPAKAYNPVPTLLPRFYLPLPAADEQGGGISVLTYGQDVLSQHVYLLTLQYGAASRRFGYALDYANNNLYPVFNLRASDLTVPRATGFLDENFSEITYWERRRELAGFVTIPFIKIDYAHLFNFSLRWRRFAKTVTLANRQIKQYFQG